MDVPKMTSKTVDIFDNVFEFCGYKQIIEDVRDFCKIDEKRCTAPVLLTNFLWRSIMISA